MFFLCGLPLLVSLSEPAPTALLCLLSCFSCQQSSPACETMNFGTSSAAAAAAAVAATAQQQPANFLEPAASAEISALNLADLPRPPVESLNLDSLKALSGAAPIAPSVTAFPLDFPLHEDSYGADGQGAARDLGSLSPVMPPGFGNSWQERRLRRAGARAANGQAERSRLAAATAAQHNTRAARNGREQQRAQKISDMIEKLKVGERVAVSCSKVCWCREYVYLY